MRVSFPSRLEVLEIESKKPCGKWIKSMLIRSVIDILINGIQKTRGADRQKNQIFRSDISNPLTACRRDQHDVAWLDDLRRQTTDFNPAQALYDDITLDGSDKTMPACRNAWLDAGPCNGHVRIVAGIGLLDNETLLRSVKFIIEV